MTTSLLRAAIAALVVVAAAATPAPAGQATAQATSKTRADVVWLASDQLAGRQAGSAGAALAADHMVAELKKMGASPLPGLKDFRLPFSFTAGVKDAGTTLQVTVAPSPEDRKSVV